ncbi:sugar MFS transporter [Actinotalea sp. Marseille-Q4924]|uniref:MFS transporter n=1 Tax=Actinotalea sp. Marseille-Q4924 TaxID=2866571 RepID=UPI001CE4AD9E|nr:MFS transporter [Actinotalea sp. Marseille-Q4924]
MTSVRRDRLTVTLYGTFVTWGWFLYGFGPAVPLIAAEQGTSLALAGLHGTGMAAGTVIAGAMSSALAVRLGRRIQVLVGAGTLVVGVVALLLGSAPWQTIGAVAVAAIGGGFLISGAQPALARHHGPAGAAVVTEANAMGSGVGLVAPLAVGAAVAAGWSWRPAVAVVVLLTVALAIGVLRLPGTGALGHGTATRRVAVAAVAGPGAVVVAAADGPAPDGGSRPVAGGATAAGRLRGPGFTRAFWFFWAAMLAGVAIEFSTTFWAAELVVSRTGAGPSVATATVSALVAGMTAARLVVGPLSLRKAPEKLLLVAYAVAAVGFVILWTATSPGVAVLGLVVAGLGYGAHYPLAVSLVLQHAADRPDQAQATSTVGTGIAVGLAPFLLGALADAFGSHTAFLLVPVLLVAGATAVALGLRTVLRTPAETRPA